MLENVLVVLETGKLPGHISEFFVASLQLGSPIAKANQLNSDALTMDSCNDCVRKDTQAALNRNRLIINLAAGNKTTWRQNFATASSRQHENYNSKWPSVVLLVS